LSTHALFALVWFNDLSTALATKHRRHCKSSNVAGKARITLGAPKLKFADAPPIDPGEKDSRSDNPCKEGDDRKSSHEARVRGKADNPEWNPNHPCDPERHKSPFASSVASLELSDSGCQFASGHQFLANVERTHR
jgi:hypothetical protein